MEDKEFIMLKKLLLKFMGLDRTVNDIADIKGEIEKLSKRLDKIEDQLKGVSKRLDKIEDQLKGVSKQQQSINQDWDDMKMMKMEKNRASADAFNQAVSKFISINDDISEEFSEKWEILHALYQLLVKKDSRYLNRMEVPQETNGCLADFVNRIQEFNASDRQAIDDYLTEKGDGVFEEHIVFPEKGETYNSKLHKKLIQQPGKDVQWVAKIGYSFFEGKEKALVIMQEESK